MVFNAKKLADKITKQIIAYMKDEYFLPLDDLDMNLFLNRGENRKKLVSEWKRLTGKEGNRAKDFSRRVDCF